MSEQIIAFRVVRGDILHHPSETSISGVVLSVAKDEELTQLHFTVKLDTENQQVWVFAKNATVKISEQSELTETTEAQPLTMLDDLQEADAHTILIDFSEADLD